MRRIGSIWICGRIILNPRDCPGDGTGPVFAEPWQAQAFALVVRLHAEGAFTWTEWAAALSDALAGVPGDDAGNLGCADLQ